MGLTPSRVGQCTFRVMTWHSDEIGPNGHLVVARSGKVMGDAPGDNSGVKYNDAENPVL